MAKIIGWPAILLPKSTHLARGWDRYLKNSSGARLTLKPYLPIVYLNGAERLGQPDSGPVFPRGVVEIEYLIAGFGSDADPPILDLYQRRAVLIS